MANNPSPVNPHSRSASVASQNSISKSANPSFLDTTKIRQTPRQQQDDATNGVYHSEKDEQHGISERVAEATEVAKEQDSADRGDEADIEYPSGFKLGLITAALCLSVFCMALDNTIIATALPRITDQFHSLDDTGWYASAYLLTTCAFQLIFGKLYTFYSIKWTYLSALFIFELGSLICGVAPSSIALIVGRAVAGLGSAGIFSGAILIVAHTVPLRQRPTYTGLIGGMYGIASVAGPLMGGAFTDNPKLTWRWCFYINLPFGLVTTRFIVFFFTSPRRTRTAALTFSQKLAQMDLLGSFFFLPGVVCLLLALQWGGTKYHWGNGRIIALLVLSFCLITAFVLVQAWRQEKATVPPRIFKNRNIWGCAFFGACLGGAFFVMMFYVSISRIASRNRILTNRLPAPYLVPGHQGCECNQIWYHEFAVDPWTCHRLHGIRCRCHHFWLLHPIHVRFRRAHVYRSWLDEHIHGQHWTRHVDRLSVPFRGRYWIRYAADTDRRTNLYAFGGCPNRNRHHDVRPGETQPQILPQFPTNTSCRLSVELSSCPLAKTSLRIS
jgi:MFS family permease